jgi:adenine-specific DNA-methyltransferase
MYPRLKLARNLLTDEGVIFISLDDVEIDNVKKICNELFGEENFICNFVRKNKAGSGHDSKRIAVEFDYIVCYCKNINEVKINQEPVKVDEDPKYKFSDGFVERRGKYYLRDLDYKGNYSEKMDYPIETPDRTIIYSGGEYGKPNTWRWSQKKFKWGIENNFIEFKKNQDKWKVYIKQYQFVDNNNKKYIRQIPHRALIDFSNGQGTLDFNNIMEANAFSFPKPVNLLEYLLNVGSNEDSIVLDFFSGSSTTANAVIKLNSKNKENRKFIMVQLPESTDEKSEAFKSGYKTIAEIGKERIRRAGDKIKSESNNKDLDIGFKVFKLDSSNLKKWDPDYKDPEQSVLTSVNNIKSDRTELDLLYEIMLKYGINLTLPIEEYDINNKKIYSIGFGALLVCLDNEITSEIATEIIKLKEELSPETTRVVFKDNGFKSDSDKTNIKETLKTNNIDEFITI